MMRNTRLKVKPAGLFALVFAASVLLFTAGCHNPLLQDRQGDQATGTVLLTLGSGTAARTILPDAPVLAGIYQLRVVLQHTTNALYSYDEFWDTDRNIFMRELAVGTWDLDVYAYAEVEGLGPVVVAQGSRQVEVLEGRTTPAPIELSPVGDAGQGTFEWDITLPAGVTARMEIRNQDGSVAAPWEVLTLDSDNVASGSTLLASGIYLVIFELTKNGEVLELAEVLHVYQHLTSLFGDEITVERFPQSLLAIMADAWDGSVFAGITINHNHFAALGTRGVTGANLEYLLESFGELVGSDLPSTLPALAALVDAALIDVLGQDPHFTFAGEHAGQAAVETAIRNLVRDYWNDTYIDDFSWANAPVDWGTADDVLTVTIGGHEVVITFTAVQATVDTVTITPATPISFVVGVTPDVRLGATLATTPSGIIFPITWTSNNSNVIFVDADGESLGAPVIRPYVYVRGIGAAVASIIATADGVPSAPVAVTATLPDAYSVTIGFNSDELDDFSEGDSMTLTATVVSAPAGADFPVVWAVDAVHVRFLDGANRVATITTQPGDHAVTIVGVSEGSATVTAAVYGFPAVNDTLVVDVAETVIPPTVIPFTWNFQATPAIPGWAQVAGANPDGATTNAGLNLTDVDHVNNMRLLPSHTYSANPGIAWVPAATRGSSNWNAADNTAFPTGAGSHVPGITDGRIQLNALASGEYYFLSIADVPRPFTIAVDVASTGGPHPNRGATLLVDGAPTGFFFATPATGSGQAAHRTTHTITGTGTADVQLGLRTNETIRIYRIHIEPAGVIDPVVSVQITGYNTVAAGAQITLTADVTPATAISTVTWEVQPEGAMVSHTGTTVTIQGQTANQPITVTATSVGVNAGGTTVASAPFQVAVTAPPVIDRVALGSTPWVFTGANLDQTNATTTGLINQQLPEGISLTGNWRWRPGDDGLDPNGASGRTMVFSEAFVSAATTITFYVTGTSATNLVDAGRLAAIWPLEANEITVTTPWATGTEGRNTVTIDVSGRTTALSLTWPWGASDGATAPGRLSVLSIDRHVGPPPSEDGEFTIGMRSFASPLPYQYNLGAFGILAPRPTITVADATRFTGIRWYLNGVPLPGQTGSSLPLTVLGAQHFGSGTVTTVVYYGGVPFSMVTRFEVTF